MARLTEAWAWRLTLLVLAVLGTSIAWYVTLWAISPRTPTGDQVFRVPWRHGRAFYVDQFNAAVLWGFLAVWAVLILWGGILLLRDRSGKPPEHR